MLRRLVEDKRIRKIFAFANNHYALCRRRHNEYLYCHPGPDGKLIQAKYFGKVRDDIEIAECGVSQLKVKANDSDSIDS